MNKDNEVLATEPVVRLLFKLAIPTVIAQLVNLLYNMVDRVYVGRIPEVGTEALAGLGVTFPIVMLVAAFAGLAGMGGSSRAAIAMGKGDHEKAEKYMGNATTLLLIFSIVLTVVFQLTKNPILLMFGASEQTLPYASSYLTIYLIGTIFVQMALGLNTFITNQGFAKTSMTTVCIGAVLNIILDPIFIFGLGLGVQGAALATIISQAVSAVWVLRFLTGKKTHLKLRLKNMLPDIRIIGSILALGVSPFIMQSTESLIQLIFNTGMKNYGNDMYVAVMSILFSIMQVVWLPMQGFAQGAQPIISYNYGAGNLERVKKCFRTLFVTCMAFSLGIVLLVELFPGMFMGIFSDNQELIQLGMPALRVFMAGMCLMGAQTACQQTFLALGESLVSMFLALLRKVILLMPLALLLPFVTGWGVWGLFIAEPISDVIAVSTTVVMFAVRSRKLGL
ncbi:MAG: MATE family efflux transporter [Lachnospiraceae bacterium]|nr:MATE family efflux transporter [Lachnospiraceae bacterium]